MIKRSETERGKDKRLEKKKTIDKFAQHTVYSVPKIINTHTHSRLRS